MTRLDLRSPPPEDSTSGLRQIEDEDEDISGTIVETLRRQATLNMALLTGAGSTRSSREMPPRAHSMPETEEQRRRSDSAPAASLDGDVAELDATVAGESTAFLPDEHVRT